MPSTDAQNHELAQRLLERARQRKLKKLARQTLAGMGCFIPFPIKLKLGKLSSKLSYFLISNPPFVVENYLGKYRVKIDPRSDADRALLRNDYEREVIAVVERNLRPGNICIDIGANVGAIAMAMARKVGAEGKVICFEPGPPFAKRLNETKSLNDSLKNNLTIVEMGLSNQSGTLHWEEDEEFPGNAYLFGPKGTQVPVTTLDEYFSKNPIAQLDFVKIDVEGMELEVLEGGVNLIKKYRPTILFETLMDFELFREKPIRKLAAQFLSELNYEFYDVSLAPKLSPVIYPNFGANTLAVPKTN